mmetsp:Transcript_25495/g.22651  ORF Transcript_25495/g.22651 Transcript_25495/m.22651 type:complete len:128 (+) Transcript_25495:123-506(+)
MNSKHKELLLKNENVLKFFVYNKLVSKDNTETKKTKIFRQPTRHDTKDYVTELLNNTEFISKLKNNEFKKMQRTEAELRMNAMTPDLGKEEKKTETKTQNIMKDLKTLVRQVTNREAVVIARSLTKK